MSHDKAERVEKLLRVAAPGSGATEPERASAALLAAEMFAAGEFEVVARRARRRGRAADDDDDLDAGVDYTERELRTRDTMTVDWYLCHKAFERPVCSYCNRRVPRNRPVWMRVRVGGGETKYEYAHFYVCQ